MSSNSILYYAVLRGVNLSQTGAAAAAKPAAAAAAAAAPKQAKKKAAQQGSATEEKVTFNVPKDEDFALWFEQICVLAELIDKRYPVKGMPVMRPYGFYMHSAIMRLIEAEWEALGTQLCQFPAMIPESFLALEKDHVRGFEKECFWVTHGGINPLEERLAMRPTSETAMYFMFAKWIQSYRDLPLQIHQSCAVYRYETKDTTPLIRIREIHWNEAHTAHASHEEAVAHLEDAWKGYLTVLTGKLGMTGMRLRRPVWDKFAGSEHTDVMDSVMPCGKVLQTVGAHYLGQKFAKVFNISFLNKAQSHELAYMTCYGVSTRLLAATIAAHGDARGLVLPAVMAPKQIVVVPIVTVKNAEVVQAAARETFALLKAAGIRVELDDSDKKPGEKFYHWEMKGVPLRVEIGGRDVEAGQVTIIRRDTSEKTEVPKASVVSVCRELFDRQTERLRDNALAYLKEHITECSTMEEVTAAMKKGGFARVAFIGMGDEGREGDKLIRAASGGEVRGRSPFEPAPPAGTKCIATGEPATCYAYVARSY